MNGKEMPRRSEIEDRAILQGVLNQMLADARLGSNHITLEIENGALRLTGEVSSYREKLAAHEIARDAGGVTRVANDLKVCGEDEVPTERALADNVRDALRTSPDVTKATIIVSTQDGKISLTGAVGSSQERASAEEVVQQVSGVTEVANLLLVDPDRKVSDEELSFAIEAALHREAVLNGQPIDVAVHNGQVVLAGLVDRRGQRSVAQAVVERFGVRRVRNELAVREETST